MIVLSQEAYGKFVHELKDGGVLIVEQDLVRVTDTFRKKSASTACPPPDLLSNWESAWCSTS